METNYRIHIQTKVTTNTALRVYTTIYVREAASGKSLSQLVPNVFVFLKYLRYDCTLFDQI